MKLPFYISAIFSAVLFLGCEKSSSNSTNESTTTPPNFTIVDNNDGILSNFSKKIDVFEIPIYAVAGVEDARLIHAANVMAQYLDNDEDGTIDNPLVHSKMKENKAFMVMWKNESDLEIDLPDGRLGQDLGNDETQVNYVSGGKTGRFDASLEEVLHIITHAGYAQAYPEIFGETTSSEIAKAMDIARGGYFVNIPATYPEGAWYTYDDETCNYSCMVTEYHYWALTTILGAQENRSDEIQHEWKLTSKSMVETQDPAVYQLLTNETYKFPKVLPDGKYQ